MTCDKATSTEDLVQLTSIGVQTESTVACDLQSDQLDPSEGLQVQARDKSPSSCENTSEREYTDTYVDDPDYTGSPYHSQPCFSIHGVSYTPPGWKRVTVKRRKLDQECIPPFEPHMQGTTSPSQASDDDETDSID